MYVDLAFFAGLFGILNVIGILWGFYGRGWGMLAGVLISIACVVPSVIYLEQFV